MKSDLFTLIRKATDQRQALNWMREYLQARILAELQNQGAMTTLAFHGGTALRFLFDLPRFSEDLDFTLEKNTQVYDFQKYLTSISNELALEGYPVVVKFNDQKTVHSAFINFPGLLFEFNLSPHRDQNFSVKLEIDINPPAGATLTTSLIRHRELFLNLQHHDKASLLSGKLHAILQRHYLKGRDVFDLIWYLSDRSWPPPNFIMLNNALSQSNWAGPEVSQENWKQILLTRLDHTDIRLTQKDVTPFLAHPEDSVQINQNIIRQLLNG